MKTLRQLIHSLITAGPPLFHQQLYLLQIHLQQLQKRHVAFRGKAGGMGLMRELSNIGNNSERREGLLTSLENGWLDASFVHCCFLIPYQRPTTPPRARLDCWQQHHFSSWLLEILPEYVQH